MRSTLKKRGGEAELDRKRSGTWRKAPWLQPFPEEVWGAKMALQKCLSLRQHCKDFTILTPSDMKYDLLPKVCSLARCPGISKELATECFLLTTHLAAGAIRSEQCLSMCTTVHLLCCLCPLLYISMESSSSNFLVCISY